MKTKKIKPIFLLSGLAVVLLVATSFDIFDQKTRRPWWKRALTNEIAEELSTQINADGTPLEIILKKGKAYNHPIMAIWVEDLEGNYIGTLYVAKSIAKGFYRHGDHSSGRWQPGPVRRPAALPYWSHQRGVQYEDGLFIPTPNHPMPDAVTGPTPKGSFRLHTQIPQTDLRQFRILLEINQSWDWNHFWHNNKFPDDANYKTSSQPAVVYEALVDLDAQNLVLDLKPIGHSHWSGKTGELFTDLKTLTTALNIVKQISVRFSEK